MNYEELTFKIPEQCADYSECSAFVTESIENIVREAIRVGRNKIVINTNLKLGLPMENTYDLKYLSSADISYNPALGSGQLQVRDIHYVTLTKHTTWESCQLLDRKFISSKKGFNEWLQLAKTHEWIKPDE